MVYLTSQKARRSMYVYSHHFLFSFLYSSLVTRRPVRSFAFTLKFVVDDLLLLFSWVI